MPLFLEYNCEDCGKKFKFTDDYMICLKDDKLVEMKFSPLPFYEIKGYITKTYCNNCGKFIKIYSPHYIQEKDKKRSIEEIKEYLTHKRPRKSINIFMEEVPSNTVICPECNKEVNFGFSDMDKCPNCGSAKFDGICMIVEY